LQKSEILVINTVSGAVYCDTVVYCYDAEKSWLQTGAWCAGHYINLHPEEF